MKLNFRTLRGEPFELTINSPMSVKSIKEILRKEFHLIPSNITLINGTKILIDTSIIDPEKFKSNSFIIIHEDNQSMREYISKSTINLRASYSLLRTSSLPASSSETENKSVSASFTANRRNVDKSSKIKFKAKNGIDEDFEKSNEFNEILTFFVTMGFEKKRSVELLRQFNYDIDAAISYSITGNMPTEEIEEDEEESKNEVVQEKPQNPKPKPRTYDVSGLSRYRFGEFNSQIQSLSNEKQYGLLRFLSEHRDMDITYLVQIFFSCDSDYTIATHCLVDV